MYIQPTLVKDAFLRLKTNTTAGKRSLERTSSLMVFLSYAAMAKKYDREIIDVDFDNAEGEKIRTELSLEFDRLLGVASQKSIVELGAVTFGGKNPRERLSSNFLTTHIPAARKQAGAFLYPKRPQPPVLVLGKGGTGLTNGIKKNQDWSAGLEAHLTDVQSRTPFSDLAIFVLRGKAVEDCGKCIQDVLASELKKLYPADVAEFWRMKMKAERPFAKYYPISDYLSESYNDMLAGLTSPTRRAELNSMSKHDLVELILTLESK